MISCVSEIIGSRKEDGLERLQEGGRETIWGLLGLHSFIHSLILNLFTEGSHRCYSALSCRKANVNCLAPRCYSGDKS